MKIIKLSCAIFVGLLAAISSLYFFKLYSPQIQSLVPLFTASGQDCSGNGIRIGGSNCICDLGWRGSQCNIQFDILKTSGKQRDKTVLLVTEYFSPVDAEHENSIYYTTLASFMVKSGYQVTVLLTGPPPANFAQLKKVYETKKVEILLLQPQDIRYDGPSTAATSHLAMRFILAETAQRGGPWELIFFFGSNGIGYYSLSAQRQGLLCIGSHFVVGMDSMSPLRMSQLQKGSKTAIIADEDILTSDWMQQRTVEMADTCVFASKAMLDYALESSWRVSENVYILPHLTVPVANDKMEIERAEELIPARQTQVKEFVYVGSLGVVGGLTIFLNAIDNLLSRDQKAHKKLLKNKQIKITFYGPNDVANEEGELTGEHYIEMRSYSWGNRIKFNVNNEMHLKKLIKYLTEPGKGRVAVIPKISDSSSFILHQSLRAGVPIIASNLKSSQELVHIQDRRDLLFATNDTVALSKKMLDILNNGVLLGRPQVALKQYEAQWRQLLSDIHSRPLPSCPSSNYLPPLASVDELTALPNPLVTVVITHHNRYKLLQQAIDSIEKQTFKDFEVIIVDDGSTDPEAIKFISELGWHWWQERAWKVLREPNRYLGAARNTGAKHARGKYILFMDDDDIAKPNQIESMLRVAEISGADVVTTGHEVFHGRSLPNAKSAAARYVPLGAALNVGVLKNLFGDSNMLVHRQFFLDMGGFTEEYGIGFEDYEFLAKVVARDNHLEAVAEPLHWYRQHPGTMSLQTDLKAGQVRFLRSYMEVFQYLPKMTQGLLRYAQTLFFKIDQGPMIKYALANTTTTTTQTPSTSTQLTTLSTTTTIETTVETITSVETTTTSTDTSTDFTFITSTLSRQTFITSLMTPGGTCPCRSHSRRTRVTLTSSSIRSTCTSTETITPTIMRTAKATTLTVTYTPTVTCDGTTLGTIPPPQFLVYGGEEGRLFMELDRNSFVTSITTVFNDAPPARAPMAISAEYSQDGKYVRVSFDRPLNVEVGRRFKCDALLVTNPQGIPNGALLAKKPDDCRLYFASPVEMRIFVDPRVIRKDRRGIQPGKLIVFRENVLSNVDSLNRAFVSGMIDVAPPADPDPPIVIAEAPLVVGGCDETIRIDLTRSSGSAGRPFIDAHFDFNSTAVDNHFMDAPLRQFLHSAAINVIKTGNLWVDIPTSLLTDFTAYTFQFSLWNIFDVGGTGYATISKVPNVNIPTIEIDGSSRVRQDEQGFFAAILPQEVCGKPFNYTLSWRMVTGPSRPKIKGPTKHAISFGPGTLEPGDYVLSLRVVVNMDQQDGEDLRYNPASQSPYIYTHSFSVIPAVSRVEILGGSRLIGSEDSTRLLARIMGGDINDFSFSWSCLAKDRESPCELWDGQEWNLTEETSNVLVINSVEFLKGTDMELMVTATHKKTGMNLFDTAVVAVGRAPNVPRVELNLQPQSIVTTFEKSLVFKATVARPRNPDQSYNNTFFWESLPFCNQQYYAVAPEFNSPLDKANWISEGTAVKTIDPATLLPGAEYCIRVAVLDGFTKQLGWSYRVVKVREPPSGGFCELTSAAVGIAFEHKFTVACHGWTGPNLRYRFKTRIRGDPIPLAPASEQSQISFTTDVGHYLIEVDILDEDNLMTTVQVRNISARYHDLQQKDLFLAKQLARFEKSKNPRLGHEILSLTAANLVPSVLAGQVPAAVKLASKQGMPAVAMASKNGNFTLSRILQVVDTLTLSENIDATESGPYFLDYLQRILPNKIPIDLRPLLLKIIHRVALGMSEDRPEGCFGEEHVIKILRLLGPIYENPRGGSSASFLVHEIKNVLETCIQRTMYCDVSDKQNDLAVNKSNSTSAQAQRCMRKFAQQRRTEDDQSETSTSSVATSISRTTNEEHSTSTLIQVEDDIVDPNIQEGEPFTWEGGKQLVQLGLVDIRRLSKTFSLCNFQLPDLHHLVSKDFPCLGYRCTFTKANMMRNNSIDHHVLELSLRNATQVITPWFRTQHVSFTIPLSTDFQHRIQGGGRPKCVWYDRYMNASFSVWSDEGCRVVKFNESHVQCACTHLTEFSIMIAPLPLMRKIPWIKLLLALSALGLISGFIIFMVMRSRKGQSITWFRRRDSSTDTLKGSAIKRSFSHSTIIASASIANDSTDTLGQPTRDTRRSRILRRPSQETIRSRIIKRSASEQAIWSTRDEDALRQQRIDQILQTIDD